MPEFRGVEGAGVSGEAGGGTRRRLRWRRLTGWALAVVGGFLALAVGPIWAVTAFESAVPLRTRNRLTVVFLEGLGMAYVAALALGVACVVVGGVRLAWGKSGGGRSRAGARRLALGLSLLAGSGMAEFVAWRWLAWVHRLPEFPTQFQAERREPTEFDEPRRPGELYLVVVGESSAEGQPYQPWLSVGQIVGRALEEVFPDRSVKVDVWASGGIMLEQALLRLWELERPPDAILVYAGHNEFQGRFGWSRNVRHYPEDGLVVQPTAPSRWLGRFTPLGRLIDESAEKFRTSVPPPPHATRALVDRPAFTPEEYAVIVADFARRLDVAAGYANRIGAVPILVVPAGNEADFPPIRSYLPAGTPESDREAFAAEFRRARGLEESDPAGAEAAYRALIDAQPGFAESHYRLGRLLAATGRREEAAGHFARARDLDGMPMRCPGDLQEAYRRVAARRDAVLVDGPKVIAARLPGGLLTSDGFHDAQHPSLVSYVALAQEVLDRLAERRAFGWPEGRGAPRLDPAVCGEWSALDAGRWEMVCHLSASFFERIAYIHHDPDALLARARPYREAAAELEAGRPLERVAIPGVEPALLAEISRRVGAAAGPTPSASGSR